MQLTEAHQLLPLSIPDRSKLLLSCANLVNVPAGVNTDLHLAYKISSVLTPILPDFIHYQILKDADFLSLQHQSKSISARCRKFVKDFISSQLESLRSPQEMESNPHNLYEMCGADIFAESNSISRSLSTAMGELWETITNISPYAVSPEKDFGIKITGIDSIILCNGQGLPTFVQIKTQKNTLTGSQRRRAIEELELHQNRLFAAAFCTGESWTFSSPNTHRVCGNEFWSLVGINYELLKFYIKKMVLKIQSHYISLKTPK